MQMIMLAFVEHFAHIFWWYCVVHPMNS